MTRVREIFRAKGFGGIRRGRGEMRRPVALAGSLVRRVRWLVVVGLAVSGGLVPLPPSATGQMTPGIVEREADPRTNPFLLKGTLSPEAPVEGEVVEIAGEVTSRIFPHIRTVVRFWIDGERREETAYVIAPHAESVVVHEWTARPGEHTVRIEVVSPAGVLYTSWERRITVRGK